jgi:hypothetical protein
MSHSATPEPELKLSIVAGALLTRSSCAHRQGIPLEDSVKSQEMPCPDLSQVRTHCAEEMARRAR